jgi:hypothetical protein
MFIAAGQLQSQYLYVAICYSIFLFLILTFDDALFKITFC